MDVFSLHLSPSHVYSFFTALTSCLRINKPVYDFIQSCHRKCESTTKSTTLPVVVTAERVRSDKMKTPFHDLFVEVGYNPADE